MKYRHITNKTLNVKSHKAKILILQIFCRIPKVGNMNWPKLDPSRKEFHYLHIAGPDQINMDSNTNLGEKEFWNSINFKENYILKHTENGFNKEEL